jgi:hypothetical protein
MLSIPCVLVFVVLTTADATEACSKNAAVSSSLLQIAKSSEKKRIAMASNQPDVAPTPEVAGNGSVKEAFEDIYGGHLWGNEGGGSGPGSDVSYTTGLRTHLKWLIQEYNLTFMIDMPCGGMVWTETFLNDIWQDRPDFQYIGIDIVGSVVGELRTRFAGDAYKGRVHVFQADLADPSFADHLGGFLNGTSPRLPNGFREPDFQALNLNYPFSLDSGAVSGKRGFTLTRDALQHLSFDKACGVLANLHRLSQFTSFQVVGSYEGVEPTNSNITTGDYFWIDLRDAPFSLPSPTHRLEEKTVDGKFLYVFSDTQNKACAQG